MKMIIVVAEIPSGEGVVEAYKIWRELSLRLEEKAKQSQGIQILGENVWLIDLESGLHFQVWLIATLNANKLKCRVAFLSEPPQWIEA